MATIAETARVSTSEPDFDSDVQRNAWLVWRSASTDCQRRRAQQTDDGYWIYTGTMRTHVMRLWPTLSDDDRKTLERTIYAYLSSSGVARCVRRQDPVVWHVAVTWAPSNAAVTVRAYRMSHAEKRVTPEEAGETLPPAPVTIRRKDTPVSRADTLNPSLEARREERTARQALIAEWVQNEAPEPVVVEEVAHQMGVNVSTARADLNDLVEAGVLFCREETVEERAIRYGQTAFARRSRLYWGDRNVIPRLTREVVEGFVVESKGRTDKPMSTQEINRRLWCKLKKKGDRSRFTTKALAKDTGVTPEATRSRLLDLSRARAIHLVDHEKGTNSNIYALTSKDKVRELLGQPETDVLDPAPAPAPAVPAPPAMGSELLGRAAEVLDENDRLRTAVTDLREKLAKSQQGCERLEGEKRQLQAALTEATQALEQLQPALDDKTARRLREWQPLSST